VVTFFTQSIPAWIEQISEWFLALPNKLAYALGFALGTIIKWGTDSWAYLSANIPVWIQSIGNFFSMLPNQIGTWLVTVLNNIVSWGNDIVSWISTNVPVWINNIVSYFSKLPSEIWNWLSQCVNNIKTWGANMLSEAVNGAENVFNGVVDTFEKLPSKMLDIGSNIVAGIKEGIKDAWNGMTGWIGSLCDDFVSGVKEALDIHSPSRVMMKLGAFTGEGFGLGIESTIGQISKQAQAMADAAIPYIDTSAIASFSGSSNAAGGINQTVNIYSPTALSPAETAKQNKKVLQELAFSL
jgi:phage-related protein